MINAQQSRVTTDIAFLLASWLVAYAVILGLNHLTLRTNAFDLSVFDYALWSTGNGARLGWVPFMDQSLLSHHFMPTLWLLWPLHVIAPTPSLLIVVQLASIAAAAALLGHALARGLPRLHVIALLVAFLFSRRSHVAVSSVYYVESLEPLLLFGMMWAMHTRTSAVYWVCLLLALGCKEDVAIYTGAFGALLAFQAGTRRLGVATMALSAVWLVLAIGVFIPLARVWDGLPAANPFLYERYGTSPLQEGLARLFRWESLRRVASMSLGLALVCWWRPRWLLPAVPAVLLNLAAKDEALQSGLSGHYLWPIVPFMFLAAIDGVRDLGRRWPRVANTWALIVILAAVGDNPIFRPSFLASRFSELGESARIRASLATIPRTARVVAQPQLIPHIDQRLAIDDIDARWTPDGAADVVALSNLGDQWPLTQSDFAASISQMFSRSDYRRVETLSSRLFVFVKVDGAPAFDPHYRIPRVMPDSVHGPRDDRATELVVSAIVLSNETRCVPTRPTAGAAFVWVIDARDGENGAEDSCRDARPRVEP